MTKPSGWTAVRALAAMVVMVTAAACGRARRAAPGALGKPLAQYSGDELYALAHQLTFTGGVERQRRCRGRAECQGAAPTRFTRLRVDAVSGEDSLSASTLPANGVIAARALNHGQDADTLYDTRPGPYEYYLIVLPGAAGTAVWRLEEVATSAGARAHRTVSTGTVRECHHPFVRGARADFKTCAQAALMHRAALALPQSDGSDPPIWFACAFGCCTADPSSNS